MGKKKILVVEDEKELALALKIRLEQQDFDVTVCYDGMEALKQAREMVPALVVLDLMIPKLDGYQVCRMLKFDKKLSNIPIILLTALSKKEDREWGKKVKADAYMTKPFETAELIEQIKKLIGS